MQLVTGGLCASLCYPPPSLPCPVCPVPREANLQGVYHAGSLLTWEFHQWKERVRAWRAGVESSGGFLLLWPHFLIFWEWLRPSKIAAPISNPSSMAQGLTSLRKLHFLPLAFSSRHGNNFLLLLASGYLNLPFWCSHFLNSPFIKVSWKILISSVSYWGSDW